MKGFKGSPPPNAGQMGQRLYAQKTQRPAFNGMGESTGAPPIMRDTPEQLGMRDTVKSKVHQLASAMRHRGWG